MKCATSGRISLCGWSFRGGFFFHHGEMERMEFHGDFCFPSARAHFTSGLRCVFSPRRHEKHEGSRKIPPSPPRELLLPLCCGVLFRHEDTKRTKVHGEFLLHLRASSFYVCATEFDWCAPCRPGVRCVLGSLLNIDPASHSFLASTRSSKPLNAISTKRSQSC
jgi:hypothetical protein